MTRAPKDVRHEWKREPRVRKSPVVYVCKPCGGWTANLPLDRYVVCPRKDRRMGPRDRRSHD